MRKPHRSIRLSGEARSILKREVVRLTINPVLLALSRDLVDWSGREASGEKIRPSELVLRARERFPALALSWAVEGYIALLIGDVRTGLKPFSVEPYDALPESMRRFRALSPSEKIRVGERWKLELRLLRRAR